MSEEDYEQNITFANIKNKLNMINLVNRFLISMPEELYVELYWVNDDIPNECKNLKGISDLLTDTSNLDSLFGKIETLDKNNIVIKYYKKLKKEAEKHLNPM